MERLFALKATEAATIAVEKIKGILGNADLAASPPHL